jgi:hypothetical protein
MRQLPDMLWTDCTNKVLAPEFTMVRPDGEMLAEELKRSRPQGDPPHPVLRP